MIRKLVIGNGRSEREILLVGNITIGRDPACHVSEPDPLLSRRHAEIVANVHGVSVRDLDSRNGILVNGEKTHEQVLLPGDIVQMGHLQLRYVEEKPRPADGLASRGMDVRRQAPPPPPPPPPSSYDFDRFRPDPPPTRPSAQATPQPGRWKPEPTPLPGRRSSAPPPPPQPHAQNPGPVPRGRAAFDDTIRVPRHTPLPDHLDQTRVATGHDTTMGVPPPLDTTMLNPVPPTQRDASGRQRWADTSDPDTTMLASDAAMLSGDTQGFAPDPGMVPGEATFAAALSHLAGLANPGHERLSASAEPGARLVANAELAITDASPGCADLLGVPDEPLIGDSLTDIFLRGVRRAYAEPDLALHMSVARGHRGSITVTLTFEKSSGTE